jgi:hypothetical protein
MANPYHRGTPQAVQEHSIDMEYSPQNESTQNSIGTRIMEFGNAVRRSSIFGHGGTDQRTDAYSGHSAFDLSASISTALSGEVNEGSIDSHTTSQYDRTGVIDDFTRPSAWTKPEEASSNQDKKKKKEVKMYYTIIYVSYIIRI